MGEAAQKHHGMKWRARDGRANTTSKKIEYQGEKWERGHVVGQMDRETTQTCGCGHRFWGRATGGCRGMLHVEKAVHEAHGHAIRVLGRPADGHNFRVTVAATKQWRSWIDQRRCDSRGSGVCDRIWPGRRSSDMSMAHR